MKILHDARIRFYLLLCLSWCAVSAVVRGALFLFKGSQGVSFSGIAGIFAAGLANDLLAWAFAGLPALLVVSAGGWWFRGRAGRRGLSVVFWICSGAFLFSGAAELVFWNEFAARFNFIAVDYLVYTTEVIRNIFESYPVVPMAAGVLCAAALLAFAAMRWYSRHPGTPCIPAWRTAGAGLLLAVAALHCNPVSFPGRFEREAASNGAWCLFHAYRHNQLDYRDFYPVMDNAEAAGLVHREVSGPDASFASSSDGEWVRRITRQGPERRLNVIQIAVESLGTNLLGKNTPVLNRLARNSLYFSRLYATGTRTVRGIEALTLSVPPTPGASIVRRPGSDSLFNVGTVFRSKGYDTAFVYGGYGCFDNMNEYFSSNGFRIVDRASMDSADISFTNAWGVCDEDLYKASLREADACAARGANFYQFVLTTSNHRPFTYPGGRVSIPSGTGRSGAVQYTDYALGKFLEEAAKRPWFKDTVVVLTGDHTSGAAGRTDLPPERYHIPAIIYSPGNIPAAVVPTLCSQIDVAPTLFGVLNWSHVSPFYGKNVLEMKPGEGRAWISTYQILGFMTPRMLASVEPLARPVVTRLHVGRAGSPAGTEGGDVLKRMIASYQTAGDHFNKGEMKQTGVLQAAGRPSSFPGDRPFPGSILQAAGRPSFSGT